MPDFRRFENNGVWRRGRTYTFEYYEYGDSWYYGVPNLMASNGGSYIPEPGQADPRFFTDFSESEIAERLSLEDLGGGWWRVTLRIRDDAPLGEYYMPWRSAFTIDQYT